MSPPGSSLHLRAVVLAAGEGRRLRPLTLDVPKPLLPVLGRPILEHTLEQLAALGCDSAAINLHHLGDQIEAHFGTRYKGMPLHYSHEERLLGTSGALAAMREFLAPADLVIVINGDSYCHWPLKQMLRRHRRKHPAATLLVTRRADPRQFGGGVGVDRKGRIVSFAPGEDFAPVKRRRVFAGAHILEPELVGRLPEGPSDFIADLYRPILESGSEEILAVTSGREWDDLGTPRRYLRGTLSAVRGRGLRRLIGGGSWIAKGCRIDGSARLHHAVVERKTTIEAGAEIRNSVLLRGSTVEAGAQLSHCIVGFSVEIPAGANISGRLVTRRRPGQTVPEGSSVLGGLVFTPLD